MYFHGIGQVEDDYGGLEPQEVPGQVYGPAVAVPASLPSASGGSWPTMSGDWIGLFKAAAQTWGAAKQSDAQIEIARIRAANPYASLYNPSSLSPSYLAPGYSPFPVGGSGTLFGMPLSTWLILAAGGAAIYIATQK